MTAPRNSVEFSGDDPDVNPADFIKRFVQITIGHTKAQRFEVVDSCFPAGTPADIWFDDAKKTVKDWDAFVAAFEQKWPPLKAEVVGPAEAARMVKAHLIDVMKLGTYDTKDGSLVAYHKRWSKELAQLARKCHAPDTCAIDVREQLPRAIRSFVPASVATWKDLCAAIDAIDTAELKERARDMQEQEDIARRVEARVDKATRELEATQRLLRSPTTHLSRAMGSMGLGNAADGPARPAARQRQVDQDPFAADGQMAPGNLFHPARNNLNPRPAPSPTDRLATMRANLPVHNEDTERGRRDYQAQVTAWHQGNQGREPNEHRPFPLTPGTAPLGSRECYRCGHTGHLGAACTATTMLPPAESTWRARAGAIIRSANAPTGGPNGAPTQAYMVHGEPFMLVPLEAYNAMYGEQLEGKE